MSDPVSLDPDDWDNFRKLSHAALDRMLDALEHVRSRPVWQPLPASVRDKIITRDLPRAGIGEQAALELFFEDILSYPNGSWHPRFLGWVQGTGVPLAMLADMLASGLNAHLAGFDQAPKWVELQVIRWVAEMLGWPANSGGLLTSGGTMANVLGLATARQSAIAGHAAAADEALRVRIYCSDQTHGWIDKASTFLGMNTDTICRIASTRESQIDIGALESAIERDRKLGYLPLCVCGNVGTVHTGAIDPLAELADVCEQAKIWLHLDGAFGALAYLSDEYRPALSAMARADSLAIDLHKWMYLPFDIGVILVKDVADQLAAFSAQQSYMESTDRGLLAGGVPLADRGIELSRSFRALKAWICLLAYGTDHFAKCIQQNIDQARYMEACIRQHAQLEIAAPVPLNIVCFRYVGPPGAVQDINRLNQELLLRLQESGEAVISSTWFDKTFVLRAAITNHRTQFRDMDHVVNCVLRIGQELEREGWA